MGETSPKPKITRTYVIGETVPLPERKLEIRPNAPIDNRKSFSPVRGPKRTPGN